MSAKIDDDQRDAGHDAFNLVFPAEGFHKTIPIERGEHAHVT